MNRILGFLSLSLFILLNSCSVTLTGLKDKSSEEIKSTYKVLQDLSYGPDPEQVLDIYLSADVKKLRGKNFTIIFSHGGGYYLSDKSKEERYIQPYLKKGMNVVNLNYRLKRGIPIANQDLTKALNFLQSNHSTYPLNLDHIILTGFSAGAQMSSLVGVTLNNPEYPYHLINGIKISGVINFSGPVDGLDVVEKVFMDNDVSIMKDIGNAFFPSSEGYAPKDSTSRYEPITYFDKNDPPFFLWYGGKDDQVPPSTFIKFVALLNEDKNKNKVVFVPEGFHSPNADELNNAYQQIFIFLDKL